MINITVYQNKDVTGDNGKIIAYVGQTYSEEIRIIHPSFANAKYGIEYKYNQTIFTDWLDTNDRAKLKIEKAGYLTCQFIAIDMINGDVLFKSKPWRFLVEEVTMPEPSHYPCNSHISGHTSWNHSNYYPPHKCEGPDFNSYEAYYKLKAELDNESDVRFNEIKALSDDIILIKNALNIGDPVASVIDANELVSEGRYIATAASSNLPLDDQQYYIIVSVYNENIVQTAYTLDGTGVWYRTGIKSNIDVTWTDWTKQVTTI